MFSNIGSSPVRASNKGYAVILLRSVPADEMAAQEALQTVSAAPADRTHLEAAHERNGSP